MPSDGQVERITVSLIPRTTTALAELSSVTGMSKTDLVNRAVQLLHFVHEVESGGEHLLIRRADGEVERVHLL
jgi:hypothetical protein